MRVKPLQIVDLQLAVQARAVYLSGRAQSLSTVLIAVHQAMITELVARYLQTKRVPLVEVLC